MIFPKLESAAVFIFSAALLIFPCQAQKARPTAIQTPAQIAAEYAAAMSRNEQAKVAKMTHPEALAAVKKKMAAMFTLGEAKQNLAKRWFGVADKAEYEQFPDEIIFELLLFHLTPASRSLADLLETAEMKIVGQVREQPDLVHIIYRAKLKDYPFHANKLYGLTLKKSGSTWKVMIPSELEFHMDAILRFF